MSKVIFLSLSIVVAFTLTSAVRKPVDVQVHVKLDNEKQRCKQEGANRCVVPGGGLLGQCCKGLECVSDDPEVVCRGPPFPPPASCTCVKPKNDGQPRCFNEEGASPC